MSSYLKEVFDDDGLLAKHFPQYEKREGQIHLARVIDRGMQLKKHVLGEGPCGTGKGVAYCVPAIHHALENKTRVVIATANIALQEQLVTKDLPTLQKVLPQEFKFVLLKGRSNYVCPYKCANYDKGHPPKGVYNAETHAAAAQILLWAEQSELGDKSELPFDPGSLWQHFSVSTDECLGFDKCDFSGRCGAGIARRRAEEADIVVTNYHLLFAHLSTCEKYGESTILPRFSYLVLDEAHEAANIARDFFGYAVAEHGIERVASFLSDHMMQAPADKLWQYNGPFFNDVRKYAKSDAYKVRLKTPNFVPTPAGLLDGLCEAVKALKAAVKLATNEHDKVEKLKMCSRAANYIERIQDTLSLSNESRVYYIELSSGKEYVTLNSKPISVAPILRRTLFNCDAPVTMVSATMTTDNNFDFIKKQTGAPDESLTAIGETPFDFERQALLVIPRDAPDPKNDDFARCVTKTFNAVVKACDGRTLGLFTSYRNMSAVRERLRCGKYRVMVQGEDIQRNELARIFKEDTTSILLGTSSFWTGIDVAGDAFIGLLIDKLPFPNMSDPIVDAICANDRNWFKNYSLPMAIMKLRQGVGRLIRSQTDYGVVVITDQRLHTKTYRRQVLASLPDFASTELDLSAIKPFLTKARAYAKGE